jgi:hypothetical protein
MQDRAARMPSAGRSLSDVTNLTFNIDRRCRHTDFSTYDTGRSPERMEMSEEPWFKRTLPDGKMEPHVALGENGAVLIMDGDGWAASFRDGKWSEGILFSHDQIADFAPVQSRQDIFQYLIRAREALNLEMPAYLPETYRKPQS